MTVGVTGRSAVSMPNMSEIASGRVVLDHAEVLGIVEQLSRAADGLSVLFDVTGEPDGSNAVRAASAATEQGRRRLADLIDEMRLWSSVVRQTVTGLTTADADVSTRVAGS